MQRIYLNDGWYFTGTFTEDLFDSPEKVKGLHAVRIPHTVCETPYNYFDENCYQMVSGYRRDIDVEEKWRSGHLLLTFEGAAHEAVVYINGRQASKHFCGYTAFTVDMVPYLAEGRTQTVVVRLDSRESLNQPPFGNRIDYMTYGGLYRDVYLDVKDSYYIKDIYAATPDVRGEEKTLKADVRVNTWSEGLSLLAHLDTWTELPEGEDEDLQHWIFDEEQVRFRTSCLTWAVDGALLWDVDMPNLYVLTVDLKKDGQLVDRKSVRVGFREAVFEEDGFYLNGEKLKLRGLNRHQSWPYVGYAMPKSPQQLDADILKFELGANIVRTSHYPQSQYFVDRCDEIGLLVFTEIPGWQHVGDTRWKKIAVRNVREMIEQYRNHPSVILWGVRINESQDDDAFYYKTNQVAHALDLYRQTGGVRFIKNSHLYEDVYTYNDFSHCGDNAGCEPKKAVTSDMTKAYFISEYNGHMYPTKTWDDEAHRVNHALRHARVLNDIEREEDIAGGTGWCMFDYNTHGDFGSGDHVCYHGVMDMFRNPKLAAALYKSQTDWEPVLAISSSMDPGDHPGGHLGTVYAFTNGDSVRVCRNGVFMGEYYPDEETYGAMLHPPVIMDDLMGDRPKQRTKMAAFLAACHITAENTDILHEENAAWDGKPAQWCFEAVRDGAVTARIVKGPAGSAMLRIRTDRQTLVEENSYDVATVHIEAVDDYGNHLAGYQEPLFLSVDGEIEIIGPSLITMRGGYAGTYVRSLGHPGRGCLVIRGTSGEASLTFEIVFA